MSHKSKELIGRDDNGKISKTIYKILNYKDDRFTTLIESVREFHNTFKKEFKTEDYQIPNADYKMRYALMEEENKEYLTACDNNNPVEIADALGDKLYILIGTILAHGLEEKIYDIFDEIHQSNMSKLDKEGKPIYNEKGKIQKGELYKEPNLKPIIYEQG